MIDLCEVWVTGIGIVSTCGVGFKENIQTLRTGSSPLKNLEGLNSIHDGTLKVGQVPLSNDDIRFFLKLQHTCNYNRTTLLALMAVNEALKANNSEKYTNQISLVSASTVGGMNSTERKFSSIAHGEYIPDIEFIDEMDCGSIGRSLIKELNLGGDFFTLSTACSSSSNAIALGSRMIHYGQKKMVLAGGSDSLSRFVLNGFLSLKNVDINDCKPFDDNRSGLNLGEGSAFLLLEERKHAEERNAIPFAKISGYHNINETYHMTGSSPEGAGAILAMNGALSKAGLSPGAIDFIHAHGTSTIDNDLAESMAIQKIFGRDKLFASSKPFTGHTLAASGAISSVLSIGTMMHGFLFPNLNFSIPMHETNMSPVARTNPEIELKHCMINSFGFGGSNTSLIISRV